MVPWKECVILRKWSTKQLFHGKYEEEKVYMGIQLEIGNRSSTIIDTLFSTLYSETKEPYQEEVHVE